MKKVIAVLLTLVLILTNVITVLAEEISVPPINQISDNPTYSEAIYIVQFTNDDTNNIKAGEDGLTIVYAYSSARAIGSTSIQIKVETGTNITAAKIGGIVYIERWENNTWSYYSSYPSFTYNSSLHSKTKSVPVQSGYYYKVSVSHQAITAYSTVVHYTSTQSILVN